MTTLPNDSKLDASQINVSIPNVSIPNVSIPNNTERTLATKYFMQTAADFETGRRALYQLGVKTSYNDEVVIFSNLRACTNNNQSHYIRECNGLILSRDGYHPLVVPPRTLRRNINTELANSYLHQGLYHIYKAQDGTCFNMYYNRLSQTPTWKISTTKGFDMNDIKWDGKTYQEIITECLAVYGLTWEMFTEVLDVNCCYSFGFKHPHFHKFYELNDNLDMVPTYKMWFIQSTVTNPTDDKYLWASEKSPIADIKEQERYEVTVNNLRELYKLVANSVEHYYNTKQTCYGFILRSVSPNCTNDLSDLYIESDLQRNIRKFWYDNVIIDACHKNNWNKEHTIVLYAFLKKNDYTYFHQFLNLFPQYETWFDKYEIKCNLILDTMVKLVTEHPDLIKRNVKKVELMPETTMEDIALKFITEFRDTIHYDVHYYNDKLKQLFRDYVIHIESLYLLVDALA